MNKPGSIRTVGFAVMPFSRNGCMTWFPPVPRTSDEKPQPWSITFAGERQGHKTTIPAVFGFTEESRCVGVRLAMGGLPTFGCCQLARWLGTLAGRNAASSKRGVHVSMNEYFNAALGHEAGRWS